MVNMYGAGKAFNLRYQQSGNHRFVNRQPAFRAPQPGLFGCHGHHHGPTNVTINQGPQGFWGFMSGLFGGLFGGGMMGGGLFGGMGGFNQLGGMSPYGMVNQGLGALQQQKTQGQAQDLSNLTALYGEKYTIVADRDGGFTAVNKKDGTQLSAETYDDMLKKLQEDQSKIKTKIEGDTDTDTDTDIDTDTDTDIDSDTDTDIDTDTDTDTDTDNDNKGKVGSGNDGWSAAGKDALKGFTGQLSVNDFAEGGGKTINGATVIGEMNSDGYPKTIQVKGYNYEFKGIEDGKAIYVSRSGKGDEYALEKNEDGSFALNQRDGMKGAGSADITSKGKVSGGNNTQTVKTEDQMITDTAILTRNADGSVEVRIPAPWKDAGKVTIPADKATGKTDTELKEMALEEIRNPKPKDYTQNFQFSNWMNQ